MYSASENDQPSMASKRTVNVMTAVATAMSQTRTCTAVTWRRAGLGAAMDRERPSFWDVERLTGSV